MKTPAIIIAGIFSLMLLLECAMIISFGAPPPVQDPPQFKHQYVDIYKPIFQKINIGGRELYATKKALCISQEFPVLKAPGTARIFILGGSVGYLFHNFPFDKVLEGAFPGKAFEVVNCGVGGYDSFRDYLVAKEIVSYSPDLIVLFSGNNEFYNPVSLNLSVYYTNKFLRKSWVFRRIQDSFLQGRAQRRGPVVRGTEKTLADYEKSIRRIVALANQKKVPIILCTLPVNFRDYPPLVWPPNAPNKNYIYGKFFLEEGDYSGAIERFRLFLEEHRNDVLGLYFLGHAYEGRQEYQKAKECYLRILDLMYCANNRACPKSNALIRRICAEEGAGLADLEAAFTEQAPEGLLGRQQFHDNCHWYIDYYTLVSEVIIREIFRHRSRYASIAGTGDGAARSFSLPHNFLTLRERGEDKDAIGGVNDQIRGVVYKIYTGETGLFETAISYLETLYDMDPDSLRDMRLSKDKVKRLLASDEWYGPYMDMAKLEKYWPNVLYHVGETYRRLGLYQESIRYFTEAISLSKDYSLPYIGRALVYYKLGNRQNSWDDLKKAKAISDNLEVKCYMELLRFS